MPLICLRLPPPLCLLIQARLASTATTQGQSLAFPFPKHLNPTPHEIFHLPRGASQSAIKSRYYELVRIYHPDCPTARNLPSSTSHSRFQAISDAYAILSGKKTSRQALASDAPYEEELVRRRRAQWRGSASSDEFGHEGRHGAASVAQEREKWDQRVLIFIVASALISTILPVTMLSPFASNLSNRKHDEARKNLAHARREARELAFAKWSARREGRSAVSNLEDLRK